MSPVLVLSGVACGYGSRIVLRDIDLTIREGEFVCLLGPNGVGKTTLFKTILRHLPPKAGTIRVAGEDTASWAPARFARTVAHVPQSHTPPFPYTVLQVVTMGRAARIGTFAAPSRADVEAARESIEALSIGALADRPYTEISGGERQLVLIARALTQEPRLLVMDEPTANLDFGNAIRVLDLARRLTERRGIAVLMTGHDPNQALRHADMAAVIDRGGRLRAGPPAEVITANWLLDTYEVETAIVGDGPHRFCLPLGG
ncbi:ABC transporter ATP-binding protein [Azospirillum argentinense]